jgi:hypothetical protein
MKRARAKWLVLACVSICSPLAAQDIDQPVDHAQNVSQFDLECVNPDGTACPRFDWMDTRNFRLIDYRRLFVQCEPPTPNELVGKWRGVNKGIVTLVGYRQFIKEVQPSEQVLIGDNIQVEQVSHELLRCCGWQPRFDESGELQRKGKFIIYPPGRRVLQIPTAFDHGAEINYRNGGNRKSDPVRLLVDRVVKIDDNHLLGRAIAKFGLIHVPLAYFVLERVPDDNLGAREE